MSMEMTRSHLSDYLVTIIIHTTFIAVTFFLFVKVGRKCLRGSQSGKTSLQGGVVPDSLRGGGVHLLSRGSVRAAVGAALGGFRGCER